MQGEKIIIGKDFTKVARELKDVLFSQIVGSEGKFFIAVSGESGSGKTGISMALSKFLSEEGLKTIVIQQDDYSFYLPKETALRRKEDITQVGLSEVQLALLEKNLQEIREGKEVTKPLVVLDKNKIDKERVSLEGVKAVIVEGIYTFVLEDLDKYIFIDRTYQETKEGRELRGRENQDELMENVLKVEQGIVALGKPKADIIITKDFKMRSCA